MKRFIHIFSLLLIAAIVMQCSSSEKPETLEKSKKPIQYKSEALSVKQLTTNTYIHTSFLKTKSFGNVPCNGLIYVNNGEALIMDSPTGDTATVELINWVQKELKCEIKGVIATHFHVDCLGGLETFHQSNITSYANEHTLRLAKETEVKTLPQQTFNEQFSLAIGNDSVRSYFFGEGHTRDNIVCHVPSEKVLFGGCLVKALKWKKGNLADANPDEWANTVKKLKTALPNLQHVVPGHGKADGTNLLDYTIELFAIDEKSSNNTN